MDEDLQDVIALANVLFSISQKVGLNLQNYLQVKALAESEGRDVTVQEIESSLDRLGSAIDRLENS